MNINGDLRLLTLPFLTEMPLALRGNENENDSEFREEIVQSCVQMRKKTKNKARNQQGIL